MYAEALLYRAALISTFIWFMSCRSRPRRKTINAQMVTIAWPHMLGKDKKCAKPSGRVITSVPNARLVTIARRARRRVTIARAPSAQKVPTQTRATSTHKHHRLAKAHTHTPPQHPAGRPKIGLGAPISSELTIYICINIYIYTVCIYICSPSI